MVDHPGIAKIAFTGSTAVGREIGSKAGQMLKRVTLELGGKSPNIILPDADLGAAIKGSFMGIYFNTGQACNAAKRFVVLDEYYDDFVKKFADALTKVEPGRAQYTHLLDAEDASVLDDIIVWWIDADRFDVMPNASTTARVLDALGAGEDTTSEIRLQIP